VYAGGYAARKGYPPPKAAKKRACADLPAKTTVNSALVFLRTDYRQRCRGTACGILCAENKGDSMAGKKKQHKSGNEGTQARPAALARGFGRPAAKFEALRRYLEESRAELDKVSWPTGKEIKTTSLAVLALIVVMSIFLGLADILLSKIMEAILSRG
jgi:preprotein translocase subunit SecE